MAARATKTALVTGANSGIGRETVRELVKAGYSSVILACRDVEAGEEARSEIASSLGGDAASRMSVSRLNLSSLDSVRELAASFSERNGSCDLLVNNAGVMMIPELRRTDDGFEEHWPLFAGFRPGRASITPRTHPPCSPSRRLGRRRLPSH